MVFEQAFYVRMDGRMHGTDSIRPFGFQLGPNNNESLLIPISIDTLVTFLIQYYVYITKMLISFLIAPNWLLISPN